MSSAASIPIGATLINVGNQTIGQFTGIQVGAGLKATPQGSVVMIESTSAAANTAVNQAAWFINAITGDDRNDGKQAVPTTGRRGPLKTFAELASRWGCCGVLNPGPGITVIVSIGSDLPATDPVTFDIALGPENGLLIQGTNTTVLHTGTFAAVTAKNRAANNALQATAVVPGGWAAFLTTGATPARVHDVTNDSYFWPAADLGANVVRLSEPFTDSLLPPLWFPLSPFDRPGAAVALGDTFKLERLTRITVGGMTINGSDSGDATSGAFVFLSNNFGFQDLWIAGAPLGGFNSATVASGGPTVVYKSCLLQLDIVSTSGPRSLRLENCNTGLPFFATLNQAVGAEIQFLGGLTNAYVLAALAVIFADLDFIFQGNGPGFGSGMAVKFGTVAIFDTPGGFSVPNNPNGDGINLGAGGGMQNLTFFDMTHAIYGSGNAGAGIGVGGGATFGYEANAPSIVGSLPATNDFTVGGATSSRTWNEGGSVWSALIVNSWANLVGPLANQAMNVGSAAKVCVGI